jgi:hypothetical protein
MRLKAVSLIFLSLALASAANAQTAATSTTDHYSRAQLKSMMQDAHTAAQYGVLAAYFARQQKSFQAQADIEKQEWARRSTNIMLTAAKYPRPVDSARYLYDYYAYKATEAGQFAARYSNLANPAPGATVN